MPADSPGFISAPSATHQPNVSPNFRNEDIDGLTPPPPPPPKSGVISTSPSSRRSDQKFNLNRGQEGQINHRIYNETQQGIHKDQRHETGLYLPDNPGSPATMEYWIPDFLKDKAKVDLETIMSDSELLGSMLNASTTMHPSLPASEVSLQEQLNENVTLATQTLSIESQIHNLRSTLTPSLLRVATLERQFRAKQEAMDDALAPWAPKAVHSRLSQGVQEQEAWCRAMEESFLDGTQDEDTHGVASDREVSEWLRKYKEGRKILELRREKKLRLEEGRVGGWK